MTYTVKFRDDALKEWMKLDKSIQQQFAKKLKKCSENPHIPSAKLRELKNCYKINLYMRNRLKTKNIYGIIKALFK